MDELGALARAPQRHGDGPVVRAFVGGQAAGERVEAAERAGERRREVVDEFGRLDAAVGLGLGQEDALLDVVEAQHPEVPGRQVDGPRHRRRGRRGVGVNHAPRDDLDAAAAGAIHHGTLHGARSIVRLSL